MNSKIPFDKIKRYLTSFAHEIKISNKLNLTDDANYAEDLYCQILNIVYDLKLKNANDTKANESTIDLTDPTKKIVVQVTSEAGAGRKYNKTKEDFEKGNQFKKYKHIIVLFIAADTLPAALTKTCKIKDSRSIKAIGLTQLLLNIKSLNIGKKKLILNILEEELGSTEIKTGDLPRIAIDTSLLKSLHTSLSESLISIDRSTAVKELFDISNKNNCLVIGKPGIGKSVLLSNLYKYCWDKGLICLFIPVNELISGSDEEISQLLKIKTGWLEYLGSYKGKKKCFLIFDAYDTAKDEALKSNVLRLINKALQSLSRKWSVIVSVREYDAYKSHKLLQLFSDDKSPDLDRCKRYRIELLTPEEVSFALDKIPASKLIYSGCKKGLKEVLCIPYFLKIFCEITSQAAKRSISKITSIQTEEQLLELYWQRKIVNTEKHVEKEQLLFALINKLYAIEKLALDKTGFLTPAQNGIYAALLSDGILTESSVYNRNIAFSHNILFDFTIARLIVSPDIDTFINQIRQNHKKPFLFRTSYLYFLNRLWIDDRSLFWTLYEKVWKLEEAPFKIIHQAFFNSIAALSYSSLEGIEPLIAMRSLPSGGLLIFRFLNALRFTIQDKVRSQDVSLFLELTKDLNPDYLWILGYYIEKAFITQDTDKNKCSTAAIQYLSTVLQLRQTDIANRNLLDHNGGLWGIIGICHALKFKSKKASGLIEKVLEILKEPEFPIIYFQRLCEDFTNIAETNPLLAQKVFLTIYLHYENSQATTRMGNSSIMGFTSTRGQDFELCKYRLEEIFPEFIKTSPTYAIKTGAQVINENKLNSYQFERRIIDITFQKFKSTFIPDGNVGDWDREYLEDEGKILKALIDFLNDCVLQSVPIDDYLEILLKESKTAFLWKNTINFLSANAKKLYRYGFEVLRNDVFFLANETTYESGELLKSIMPFLSKSDKKHLEKKILGLNSSEVLTELKHNSHPSTIPRFLSCFPKGDLQFSASRKLLDKFGIKNNEPLVTRGIRVERGAKDFLEEFQVDPANPVNEKIKQRLQEFQKRITDIESVKSEILSFTAAKKLYKEIVDIKDIIKGTDDKVLVQVSDELISKATLIIAKGWKTNSLELRNKCFEIAKSYLQNPNYQKSVYEPGSQKGSATFFVLSIRIEASQVIMFLSCCNDMPQVGEMIKDLVKDNDSLVRMFAAKSLGYFYRNDKPAFWELIFERLDAETDDNCGMHLLQHLCVFNLITKFPDKIDQALRKSADKIRLRAHDSNYAIQFCELIIATISVTDSEVAKSIIKGEYLNKEFIEAFITKALAWLESSLKEKGVKISNSFNDFLINELENILRAQIEHLKKVGINHPSSQDRFKILDHLIARIFFLIDAERKGKVKALAVKQYFQFKPLLNSFLLKSQEIEGGLVITHTGYYIIQIIERFIADDPEDLLKMLNSLVELSARTGFAGEKMTLDITLRITERYLADYKSLLMQDEYFKYMLKLLQVYVESGWQEALELIWRLNEIL